jgi:hypothetical protein
MDNGRAPIGKRQTGDPTVVACVVFQIRDPEHLLKLLREALTRIADHTPEPRNLANDRSRRSGGGGRILWDTCADAP